MKNILIIIALFLVAVLLFGQINKTIDNAQELIPENPVAPLVTAVQEVIHPTPTMISKQTVVTAIQSQIKLETVRMEFEKVIDAQTNGGFWAWAVGDHLILQAAGSCVGRIDLAGINEGDLIIANGLVQIILPAVELECFLNEEHTSVVYRDTGAFVEGGKDLETNTRRAVVEAIEYAAREKGIIQIAEQNAREFFTDLFNSDQMKPLGVTQIVITFK